MAQSERPARPNRLGKRRVELLPVAARVKIDKTVTFTPQLCTLWPWGHGPSVMASLLLTLALMTFAVSVALPVGVSLAALLCLSGSQPLARAVRRSAWAMLFVLVCLPLYLQASAWEAAAGKYGWIPLMQSGANRFWFRGLVAAGWVHGISGAAWIALITSWAVSRTPVSLLQQASLDASAAGRLWHVALPYARPAIAAAGLWVALLAATEMTVADLYGVRTLADEVYLKYAYEPEPLPIVLAYATPWAIAGVFLWSLGRLMRRMSAAGMSGAGDRQAGRRGGLERQTAFWNEGHTWDGAGGTERPALWATAACVLAAGLLVLLVCVPLVSLIMKAGLVVEAAGAEHAGPRYHWSWSQFGQTLNDSLRTFGPEFGWSVALAGGVAVVALILGAAAAAWAEGSPRRASWGAVAAVLLVLIPGPIVGMAVVHLFHNRGGVWDELYQRSLLPTVVALLPRAAPAAYLVMRAGYRLLGHSVHEAARIDGASRWQRWRWIEAPRLRPAMLVAGLVAGMVAAADVPPTLVVLPPGISTVGTRLFELLHSGVRYQAAGLTLCFCVLVAATSLLTWRLGTRLPRRGVG